VANKPKSEPFFLQWENFLKMSTEGFDFSESFLLAGAVMRFKRKFPRFHRDKDSRRFSQRKGETPVLSSFSFFLNLKVCALKMQNLTSISTSEWIVGRRVAKVTSAAANFFVFLKGKKNKT